MKDRYVTLWYFVVSIVKAIPLTTVLQQEGRARQDYGRRRLHQIAVAACTASLEVWKQRINDSGSLVQEGCSRASGDGGWSSISISCSLAMFASRLARLCETPTRGIVCEDRLTGNQGTLFNSTDDSSDRLESLRGYGLRAPRAAILALSVRTTQSIWGQRQCRYR